MIQKYTLNSVVVLEVHLQEWKEAETFLQIIQNESKQDHYHFLIDLKHVFHISSVVLGTFVTTFRNVKEKGGSIKFVNVQPCTANVFEMTRLNRVFEFFNDRETALKSFDIQPDD